MRTVRRGLWWQGTLLPDVGSAGTVVPRPRRSLRRFYLSGAGADLVGAVSRIAHGRAPRDAAAGDTGGDQGAHAARDQRGAGDDHAGKSAAAGVRGFAVGR